MRLLISIIAFLSLLFLFGGLFVLGAFSGSNNSLIEKSVSTKVYASPYNSLTIKQIDSISSSANYRFTSINANPVSQPTQSN